MQQMPTTLLLTTLLTTMLLAAEGRRALPGPQTRAAVRVSAHHAAASPPPDASYEATVLERHNRYRALHGAPPLVWNTSMAADAATWAQQVCDSRAFVGSPSQAGAYGENMAAGKDAAAMVDAWYGQVDKYDPEDPGSYAAAGQFTQLVWRGTAQLGCAVVRTAINDGKACQLGANKGKGVQVCRYFPAGNLGDWRVNVVADASDGR
jgi:hypothetical protein